MEATPDTAMQYAAAAGEVFGVEAEAVLTARGRSPETRARHAAIAAFLSGTGATYRVAGELFGGIGINAVYNGICIHMGRMNRDHEYRARCAEVARLAGEGVAA